MATVGIVGAQASAHPHHTGGDRSGRGGGHGGGHDNTQHLTVDYFDGLVYENRSRRPTL